MYITNPIDLIECVYSVHWTNQTIKQEYDIVLVDDGSDYVGTLNALAGYKIRTLEPITYAWRKAGV